MTSDPPSDSPTTPRKKSVLGLVFLTVFLDMVGFSVIFPLFPDMLEYYLALEGNESALGRLIATLASWVGEEGSGSFAVTVLFGALLGSVYSLLQFLFAPFWGQLSDRIGRRPTLLFTLAGTAFSYIIWFFAGNFMMLLAARFLGGLMAGNISTASAVVADTHAGSERAKGMGMLGAGIGLGFVIGPALGGFSSYWDVSAAWPGGAAFGVNPFSGPAAISFILAMLNLLWVWRSFPETLPPEKRGKHEQERTLNPVRALKRLDLPGVARTNFAYFLFFGAFGAMEFTLTFLAREQLNFGPADNAYMFVFIGLLIAFVQGGLVRRLIPKLGERKLTMTGMALTMPGFLLVGYTESVGQLYAGLAFLAVGSALVMPSLTSLVSRYTPADRQGLSLGIFRSLGSLARAIGPLAGGILYYTLGREAPYLGATLMTLPPLILAFGLPPIPAEQGAAKAPE